MVAKERATERFGKKDKTAVAMDFGRITLRDGEVLHLYGTPGHERFDFVWEILSEGMLGYVVLIDGTDPASFDEGKRIIKAFDGMSEVPFVIGLTRADSSECASATDIKTRVAPGTDVDIIGCDARKVNDIKEVLLALLERGLEQPADVGRAEAG